MLESEARSAPQEHLTVAVCENRNLESDFKGKESLLGSQGQFSGQMLVQLGLGKNSLPGERPERPRPPATSSS